MSDIEDRIHRSLDDDDERVRWAAAAHPEATEKNLIKAMGREDHPIRFAAAKNPVATKKIIDMALLDENHMVRFAVFMNPNIDEGHIKKRIAGFSSQGGFCGKRVA